MKVSVSLPAEDVATLDEYARAQGLGSRSAAVHRAIQLLRYPELERDYADAWAVWEASGDRALWETVIADGMPDASR